MSIEFEKKQHVNSVEEFTKKISQLIDIYNRSKEGECWVCGAVVKNWAVLFPEGGPEDLGLGATESNGKVLTRIAFFPICKEHDIEDEDTVKKVRAHLSIVKSVLTN